ncbi:GNAT family N-acetyltransferase [Stigmatella aurantiaca]|uniref:GNAT family N-acetyltransferase n=1 Tax=Stigmatella aurantiaca TaxID=41 RepID=UPI0011D18ED3|nr:GNAT family N-acetyltransferase [Stigmatella aurantiaca]
MRASSFSRSTPPNDELRLVPVKAEGIRQPELRRRAKEGGATAVTKLYLAVLGVEEVGLLSVDVHVKDFYIYEIYVVRRCRRNRIGSYLLAQAERIAVEHGHPVAQLKPHALDPEHVGRDVLVEWYRGCGYVPISQGDSEFWLKRLAI